MAEAFAEFDRPARRGSAAGALVGRRVRLPGRRREGDPDDGIRPGAVSARYPGLTAENAASGGSFRNRSSQNGSSFDSSGAVRPLQRKSRKPASRKASA